MVECLQHYFHFIRYTAIFSHFTLGNHGNLRKAHLEVLFDEISSLTKALHDGFIPQNVLLRQVLASLSGLQDQAVHHVEIRQKVPNTLLKQTQTQFPITSNSVGHETAEWGLTVLSSLKSQPVCARENVMDFVERVAE